MEWFFLALARAVFSSGKEISTKISLLHPAPSITISAFYLTAMSVLFLMPYVLWDGSWQSIYNEAFLYAVLGNIAFNTIGHLLLLTTVRKFDISYVSALFAASPLVFGLFSALFLGDIPGLTTFIFMIPIAIGGLLVELSRKKIKGFKDFIVHSGWIPILAYTCIAAVATVFSKIAVTHGDPEAYIAFRYLGLSIIFLSIHFLYESHLGKRFLRRKREAVSLRLDKHAMMAGTFMMCAVICEMNALTLTDMARVESITKFSIVLTLLLEALFISKKIQWRRLLGILMILTGGIGILFT